MAKLTGQEITRVKGMGFLLNRGPKIFPDALSRRRGCSQRTS